MADKYRVGIIGCGSIAGLHVQGYRGVEEVEIVAIADPVEDALNAFGENHNIQTRYLDAREMLDKENLDIVSVATWHRLHAPMTIAACARKPKAILCEKPMATNLGDCDDMLIAARRNNVKVAIAHQRRFNPVWTDARPVDCRRCDRRTAPNRVQRRSRSPERLLPSVRHDALCPRRSRC